MQRIQCSNCDYQETLVNDETPTFTDRCPQCGAVGTLEPTNE